jgi:hypothetical protein
MQPLGNNIPAAMDTYTIIKVLDASICARGVPYCVEVDDPLVPELLVSNPLGLLSIFGNNYYCNYLCYYH